VKQNCFCVKFSKSKDNFSFLPHEFPLPVETKSKKSIGQ
jgi:hypothetical protein